MITREKILPTVLIILDIGCAIGYLSKGDIKKMIYWLSAGILTYCVTY